MSFDRPLNAIQARQIGKRYVLGASPYQRLWQLLSGRESQQGHFNALEGIDLDIAPGEAIGLIGQNGAGKSTLLQLLCGTLTPSHGHLQVNGQVAALLELGAGFNQDFTGRENILFSAALYGMSPRHIQQHLQEIIEFADIGEFIDQPVRTYSSGMYVRLAFSIATTVKPDILVIDEALAVGDGVFARKSFDRIMQLKQEGVTLLFCSHSLFQVEALCQRCIWLHQGKVMAQGPSAQVISQYNDWLAQRSAGQDPAQAGAASLQPGLVGTGVVRLTGLKARCDDLSGTELHARSGESELGVEFEFMSDPHMPMPNLALMVYGADGRVLCSTGTWIDGVTLTRNETGLGRAHLRFPKLPLLKGRYTLSAYLMCERAVHVYEGVEHFASVQVTQPHLEQGVVSIPHQWQPL
ncbi:ABC transporter ATP-binding protein [Limnohabitans sp. Rim28]|uniref:ABC transporter ATP-binding protein n=1 Tax=Limnohabitans sp. Rim28 TaxID=1100720 RepID=UPI0002F26B98|nr:ABC transporter ATP-binding protein [Limnohabitans sp. Rim28]